MKLKKITGNTALRFILPPFITVVMLTIIMAIKGVAPFGEFTVVQYDLGVGEFGGLLRLCDVLHGDASALYNWTVGCGTGSELFASVPDPLNFLFALLPRTVLLDALPFFMAVRFAVISVCAYFFFNSFFPGLSYNWQLILTMCYTFSGYTARYYPNLTFLTYAAVLPLLAVAVKRLLENKKYFMFIACMTFLLMSSVYFAFFFVLFLIFIGGLYIFCFYEKQQRGKMAFRLGTGMLSSFVISAGSFVPLLINTLSGTRFQNAMSLESTGDSAEGVVGSVAAAFKNLYLTENNEDFNKLFMIVGTEFAVLTLIFLILHFRSDKKKVGFFAGSVILFILPVIFENINLIWHGGAYNGYSMRYGFMLILMLLSSAAYYYEKYFPEKDRPEKNRVVFYVKFVLTVLCSYVMFALYNVFGECGWGHGVFSYEEGKSAKDLTETYLWYLALVLLFFFLISLFTNRKLRTAFLSVSICVLFAINSYRMFTASVQPDTDDDVTHITDGMAIAPLISEDNTLIRVVNKDAKLWSNYGYPSGRSTIGGWNHSIGRSVKQAFLNLGYTAEYTVLTDIGGTPFSDALLNVRDYIFGTSPDPELYSLVKELPGGYELYKSNYSIGFGIMFDESVLEADSNCNSFEYQNILAAAIKGSNDEPFVRANAEINKYKKTVDISETDFKKDNPEQKTVEIDACDYSFSVPEGKVLYMSYGDNNGKLLDTIKYEQFHIFIDGEVFTVPELLKEPSELYPIAVNNSITEIPRDGNFTVRFEANNEDADFDNILFYYLDTAKLESICNTAVCAATAYSAGNSEINISASLEDDGYMLVPVTQDESWQCTVNGKSQKTQTGMGDFIFVPLSAGDSTVVLKYIPKATYCTVAVFLSGSLITALAFMVAKKKKTDIEGALSRPAGIAFCTVYIISSLVVYILPLAAQIYMILK